MQAKLGELASLVEGQLIGDGELMIRGAAPLCDAEPGEIALLDRAENSRDLAACRASAIVAPEGFEPEAISAIRVADTHAAFARIVCFFRPPRVAPRSGISPAAHVSPSARIADDVEIHPFATIGDNVEIAAGVTVHSGARIMAGSKIGPGATIFPNVVLHEDTTVGAHCLVHAAVTLGCYGSAYNRVENQPCRGATPGNVALAADIDVGAGTTIHRGTFGSTSVGQGTKIDNHVVIAHDERIGEHNLLCSQVGIAGNTDSGDYVVVAGQAGVGEHLCVHRGAVLGAMAGVIDHVPAGARIIGIPAVSERDFWVQQAHLARLPDMIAQFESLNDKLEKLSAAPPS